jgi:hypothetical protein
MAVEFPCVTPTVAAISSVEANKTHAEVSPWTTEITISSGATNPTPVNSKDSDAFVTRLRNRLGTKIPEALFAILPIVLNGIALDLDMSAETLPVDAVPLDQLVIN